jgi:RNA polymerase sigma-70 factor (sigma-E family)
MSDILAAAASTGDASFEFTYAERWTPMVKLAALTTGSVAIAEEIVQDAFVQLHRHWDSIESPKSWLRSAVVNGCRDWVRRRGREPTARPDVDGEFGTDNVDNVAIRTALDVLTPRQRAAVVLRYFEDLPEKEIAELLDCRPGTVKSLLSRSLPKLERELRS